MIWILDGAHYILKKKKKELSLILVEKLETLLRKDLKIDSHLIFLKNNMKLKGQPKIESVANYNDSLSISSW